MESLSKFHRVLFYLKQWTARHRKLTLILVGFLLTIIVLSVYALFFGKPKVVSTPAATNNQTKTIPTPEPVKYYSQLTGLLVKTEAEVQKAVTGVMIENSPNARPQSGLKNSGIVFEAIAEGGITRFLVLYQQEKPQVIGPVRSLRQYDTDWLAAFNAGIAHVGGSYYALKQIRNGNYRDLDQFFNSGSYWRASDRYAPHNVYTSFKNLDALNKSKGYNSSKFTGFTRVDGKASTKPTASTINITISSDLYNSVYKYSAKTNKYTRYQGGAYHLDREDGKITPSVVIAMYVNEKTVFEDGWREQITTTGKGKAVIFQNGTATNVTWSKKNQTSQITFADKKGKDVPLVRGQTWIAAVPNDSGGVSWK